MKKLLLSFLVFLQPIIILAQASVYKPFPDNMVKYVMAVTEKSGSQTEYKQFRTEITGDTIINGINYRKIYSVQKYPTTSYAFWGGIRNDIPNKKVYQYNAGIGTEKLLYDFNLSLGDTLFKNEGYGFYDILGNCRGSGTGWGWEKDVDTAWVSGIDSVLMLHDGLYHKQFHFNATFKRRFPNHQPFVDSSFILIREDSFGPYVDPKYASLGYQEFMIQTNPLIEGVGQLRNPISENYVFENNWRIEPRCVTINGIDAINNYYPGQCESIVGIDEENFNEKIVLFPNPSNGKFLLMANNIKDSHFEITDVLGNRILRSEIKNETTEMDLSDYKSGIYFVRITDSKGSFVVKKIVKE